MHLLRIACVYVCTKTVACITHKSSVVTTDMILYQATTFVPVFMARPVQQQQRYNGITKLPLLRMWAQRGSSFYFVDCSSETHTHLPRITPSGAQLGATACLAWSMLTVPCTYQVLMMGGQ